MSFPPAPSSKKMYAKKAPVHTEEAPNRLFLEARRLRLKKRFSQNFLINEAVLQGIVDALQLQADEPVLEIGPGGGFLTEALLKTGARVTGVEVDRSMCYHLRGKFANHPRFRLIEADFLKVEETIMDTEFGNAKAASLEPDAAAVSVEDTTRTENTGNALSAEPPLPTGKPFKIVGNLPYGITSRIMFKLAGEIEQEQYAWRDRIQQLTVMVQKEVAERITAVPGQRAYNALSIALQLRFDIRLDAIVPARNFYPAPQVDSAVITLTPRQEPLLPEKTDMALFAKLVRTAFSAKRKTVRNALLNGRFATAAVIDQVFAATGIASDLRAEALSIAAFGELTHAFSLHPGQS